MIQLMIIACMTFTLKLEQIKVDYKLVDKLTGDYFNK